MRRCLPNALFAVAVTFLAAPALAQDARASCPPGAWFCEEVAPPPPPEATPQADDEDAEPPPPPVVRERSRRRRPAIAVHPHPHHPRHVAPPPVVVYRPGPGAHPPSKIVIVAPDGDMSSPQVVTTAQPLQPAKPRRWHRRWGLNMRLEGASMGSENGAAEEAGMGGVGLSLRFRPVPAFAFDLGIDVLGGTDYNGFQRTEMPISLNGMLFVNPRSRVQFYLIGGAHISYAEVETSKFDPLFDREDEDFGGSREYSYFGGQGGVGLEFRLSRLIAMNVDVLGFVRKRTDDNGPPEFVDPSTGMTSNKSGGALFRGGLTFWW